GDLGLGESFMDGEWETDDHEGLIRELLKLEAVKRNPQVLEKEAYFAEGVMQNDLNTRLDTKVDNMVLADEQAKVAAVEISAGELYEADRVNLRLKSEVEPENDVNSLDGWDKYAEEQVAESDAILRKGRRSPTRPCRWNSPSTLASMWSNANARTCRGGFENDVNLHAVNDEYRAQQEEREHARNPHNVKDKLAAKQKAGEGEATV
ncbi:unnamed protein product, partial [Prorocentrum cordatum]